VSEQNNNISKLIDQYRELLPAYEKLITEVQYTLGEKLENTTIEIANLLGRTKKEKSLIDKLKNRNDINNLDDIPDIAGVRVVCLYEADLTKVKKIISSAFDVIKCEDKVDALGVDRMGYRDLQFVVRFGSRFKGPRYDKLKGLNCEIQVRNALQDAWSIISHRLVYKNESSIPDKLKRDFNNVTSLLEIAQGVFENIREKRLQYLKDIAELKDKPEDFLSQPIDHDTLIAYTKRRFPKLPTDDYINSLLLRDLDRDKFKTLADIDDAVNKAEQAVEAYWNEDSSWFTAGTDFLTKTMGFVDINFRKKHPFGEKTRDAFEKYSDLIK